MENSTTNKIPIVIISKIFRKDENDYINIETTSDREHTNKKYRIPKHQRHNKWNTDDKKNLIDSVWKNYIIGGISLSQHPDGRLVYFNIEDSQSRLTVIQEYLDDKLKYKNKFFSELTNDEKHRFHNYTFSVDTTIPTNHAIQNESITTIDDHYYENFDRINRGKKLEDNDQVLFQYCNEKGKIANDSNPNGSVNNIAGICNEKRNVFGMMPHPERASNLIQGNEDGRVIFESILDLVDA